MTSLHIQKELAGAISNIEGLAYVASMAFGGKQKPKVRKLETTDEAVAFARLINGG